MLTCSVPPRASVSPPVAEGPCSGLAPSLAAEAEFLLCACCARRKVLWESKYSSPRRLQAGCSLSPSGCRRGAPGEGLRRCWGTGEGFTCLRFMPPPCPHRPWGLCGATGHGATSVGACSPKPRWPHGCSASLRLCARASIPGPYNQGRALRIWGGPSQPRPRGVPTSLAAAPARLAASGARRGAQLGWRAGARGGARSIPHIFNDSAEPVGRCSGDSAAFTTRPFGRGRDTPLKPLSSIPPRPCLRPWPGQSDSFPASSHAPNPSLCSLPHTGSGARGSASHEDS